MGSARTYYLQLALIALLNPVSLPVSLPKTGQYRCSKAKGEFGTYIIQNRKLVTGIDLPRPADFANTNYLSSAIYGRWITDKKK